MIAARHGQHQIGCCGNDRLIRQRLVTIDLLRRIDAARHFDDRGRFGILARRHDAATGGGKHEENPLPALFRHGGDILGERIEPGLGLGSQRIRLVGKTHRRADILDLFGDGVAARRRIDGDERHRTCLQDGDDIGRAGPVFGEDEIGLLRQDAFGRKRPHVTDIRLGKCIGRIAAGAVTRNDAVSCAQRIKDFGDRAANRDDAFRFRIALVRSHGGRCGKGDCGGHEGGENEGTKAGIQHGAILKHDPARLSPRHLILSSLHMFMGGAIDKWSKFVRFVVNPFPTSLRLDILTQTGNLKGEFHVYRNEPLSRRAGL
ncbi:hypothetical protein AGR7A_Cc20056 [Agrobacterium deltaense NCPPB 1641]|uniref:Uncharacterized protein n=1 Tax=Agrobacterium deltaense NCPPB 1641 TaxID=1183425 RepID=A0A1S7TKL9_9HYPH|nr:hypothetical protein AGR7A_Cc20056 [Agrobacterium deltaense NCPPB 1641]